MSLSERAEQAVGAADRGKTDDNNNHRQVAPESDDNSNQKIQDASSSGAIRIVPEQNDTLTPAANVNVQSISYNQHVLLSHDNTPTITPSPTPSAAYCSTANHSSPAVAGLSIRTNIAQSLESIRPSAATKGTPTILYETMPATEEPAHQVQDTVTFPTSHTNMGSSLRSNNSTSSLASSLSPGSGSALPSPYLAAMTDLTPLPSPLVGGEMQPLWKRLRNGTPNRSREGSLDETTPIGKPFLPPTSPDSPSRKKKGYGNLMQEATIANASNAAGFSENGRTGTHTRNRSISDFQPEPLFNVRPRHVTYGQGDAPNIEASEYQMHREAYLAAQRGLTAQPPASTVEHLPTPPPSTSSVAESEEADEEQLFLEDGSASEYLVIHCGIHNKRRKFRQLRQLGQGTFSTVMLATRERIPAHPTPEIEDHLDPHKLVAVKIVEHGPAGGADEERIEVSLKREVEMLKSVSHPSLIRLKACEYQDSRALLVLTYCPGGDLFDFASQKRDLLTPPLVQRMFAELVSAVTYLHTNWIVHRDIKLENVLVNLSELSLRSLENPITHSTPIVTLTDLGLSRKLPEPPEPPLLTTRCGSEDYAAPEILLGQPYDGRLTDGWALGVLLYALMEGRLPFDAPPGKPDRSRNTHRIARCDWIWCRFGDEDGDWDPAKGQSFEGANLCVDGLLKKVRMGRKPLGDIAKLQWVEQGMRVSGGLRIRKEDEDDDL